MSLLFRIVYAAHARGTHHKLALDALRHLTGPSAEPWQRLFLKHADVYMEGAKAPDDTFKDFKNHVLHVGDKYWGGAPEKAESWYVRLVETLAAESWSEAVYCAGILSHYYSDPIHPFHTGQTEAENNIHRAVEWSISKSYDQLKVIGEALPAEAEPRLGSESGWLRDLVIQGAEVSNRHYEKLIAHYDINRGVVDPPAGLDEVSKRIVGALIVYAYRSFAMVLDRAFREAAISPPEVTLTLETVMAAIKIPIKALQKKLADGEDRRQVERMYDELKATGRVEVNLPEDDRMVRELYRVEVLARRESEIADTRSARLTTTRSTTVLERADRAIPPAAAAGTKTVAVANSGVERGGLHEGRRGSVVTAVRASTTAIGSATLTERLATVGSVATEDESLRPLPGTHRATNLEMVVLAPRPPTQATRSAAVKGAMELDQTPLAAIPAAPSRTDSAVTTDLAALGRSLVGGGSANHPPEQPVELEAARSARPALAVVSHPAPQVVSAPDPGMAPPSRRMARADDTLLRTRRPVIEPTPEEELDAAEIDAARNEDTPDDSAPTEGASDQATAEERSSRRRTRTVSERDSGPRFFLNSTDDVVAAPSIGPKMAERLKAVGIATVADLLAADAETVAACLEVRTVKTQTVRDWQDQARLVCDVPGLRGTHAQLLVGAGLRDMYAVADADPATLLVSILRFAQTRDGERVLRSGEPPDIEKITVWVQNAVRARAARAA